MSQDPKASKAWWIEQPWRVRFPLYYTPTKNDVNARLSGSKRRDDILTHVYRRMTHGDGGDPIWAPLTQMMGVPSAVFADGIAFDQKFLMKIGGDFPETKWPSVARDFRSLEWHHGPDMRAVEALCQARKMWGYLLGEWHYRRDSYPYGLRLYGRPRPLITPDHWYYPRAAMCRDRHMRLFDFDEVSQEAGMPYPLDHAYSVEVEHQWAGAPRTFCDNIVMSYRFVPHVVSALDLLALPKHLQIQLTGARVYTVSRARRGLGLLEKAEHGIRAGILDVLDAVDEAVDRWGEMEAGRGMIHSVYYAIARAVADHPGVERGRKEAA